MDSSPSSGIGLVVLALLAIVYFVPSAVAFGRHHHQRAAILVLNVFLGWTGLGWIGALVWSATAIPPLYRARQAESVRLDPDRGAVGYGPAPQARSRRMWPVFAGSGAAVAGVALAVFLFTGGDQSVPVRTAVAPVQAEVAPSEPVPTASSRPGPIAESVSRPEPTTSRSALPERITAGVTRPEPIKAAATSIPAKLPVPATEPIAALPAPPAPTPATEPRIDPALVAMLRRYGDEIVASARASSVDLTETARTLRVYSNFSDAAGAARLGNAICDSLKGVAAEWQVMTHAKGDAVAFSTCRVGPNGPLADGGLD